MKLSVVIPVYNEQVTIREIYECVKAVDIEKEMIFVDDGSTDGSREILQGLADDSTRIVLQKAKKMAERMAFRLCDVL